MAYVNPGWTNGAAPAIDQDNLNDMSDALEQLSPENGGTGKQGVTAGALLKGNGSDPMQEVSGTGALYANTTNNPQFGTLPASCGGTGVTTLDALKNAMGLANGGFVVSSTAPGDTTKMWIDTGNGGILKVYDSENAAWIPVAGTFA